MNCCTDLVCLLDVSVVLSLWFSCVYGVSRAVVELAAFLVFGEICLSCYTVCT